MRLNAFATSSLALLVVTFAGAGTIAAPPAQARVVTHELNIPAQSLGDALKALSAAADEQLLFSEELVSGKQSRALAGQFTTDEALRILLEGTRLKADRTPSGVLLIGARPADGAVHTLPVSGSGQENSSNVTPPRTGNVSLDEVVVTAQKREERLQDVPISITAITAEDINRRGLVNSEDYLRGIPGVNQGGRLLGQSIVIRGVETTLAYQGWSTGTTTGVYFGEVPTTGSAGGIASNVDIKLVDIERVEVLKGPQGTAFGSSAMGGVARTIPVAPKLNRYEGKLAAGYSSTSGTGGRNHNFQAIANAPLIDGKLAVRAVAYTFSDSGFYRSRAASDTAFKDAWLTPFGEVSDAEEVGEYYSTGARIAALYQATDKLRFTLTYLTQKNEADGTAVANSGTFDQTILNVAPEVVRRSQSGGFLDTHVDIANAVMEYDLGWADVLATYSYLEGGSENANEYSAWFYVPMSEGIRTNQRGHVGEVRLVSNLDGPLNFLAGLYAERIKDNYTTIFYWTGDPATSFIPGERYMGALIPDGRELEQTAAFSEVSWRFAPGLTLTGGVRAYNYDRTARIVAEGIFGSGVSDIAGDADGATYRANLSYKPHESAHLYAGWSQGFRLGKPQSGLPPGLCDEDSDGIVDGTELVTIDSTRQVNSDEVDNYELGGKFSLLNRRLSIDVALFRMNWSGIPFTLNAPAQPLGCALTYIANAGTAKSEGIEFQANAQITAALRIDFGGSYIKARLTEDAPAAGLVAGSRLPGSPRTNANLGVQYAFDLRGRPVSLRADTIYVGTLYDSIVEQNSLTEAGDYMKLDLSARLALKDINADLYIRNVTNEDSFTARSGVSGLSGGQFYGYRLRPRTIGFQIGYEF